MAIGNGSFAKDTRMGGSSYAADQGMRYLAGAAAPGVSVIPILATSAGASLTITFADYGLPNMANVTYVVLAQQEGAPTAVVDESSKAAGAGRSFDLLNLVAGPVNVLVIGPQQGQSIA